MDFVCKVIKMIGGLSSLKGEEKETNTVTATVEEMTLTYVIKRLVRDLVVVPTEREVVGE